MKKIGLSVLLALLAIVTAGVSTAETAPERADVTVLYYALGTNLEGAGAQLTHPESGELSEMLAAPLNDRVRVAMQLGGCTDFHPLACPDGSTLQISGEKVERFELREDALVRVQTLEAGTEAQSTAAALADFIAWGVKNYPAERTILILWDHGTGSVLGALGMYTQELSAGLHAGVEQVRQTQPGFKLDMLAMDACLMGTLECALLFSDIADYYAASQETTGWHSWDYTAVLSALAEQPQMAMAELSGIICTSMVAQNSAAMQTNNTQSVLELSRMEPVRQAWESIAASLNGYLAHDGDGSRYLALARAVEQAKDYNNGEVVGMSDLVDFAQTAHARCGEQAVSAQQLAALTEAVAGAVVTKAQGEGMDIACGMSVFIPKDRALLQERRTNENMGPDVDTTYLTADHFTAHDMLRAAYGSGSEAERFAMNLMALYAGAEGSDLAVLRDYLAAHYDTPAWVADTCARLDRPVEAENFALSYDAARGVYAVALDESAAPLVMDCGITSFVHLGKYGSFEAARSDVSAWLEDRRTFETYLPAETGLRYNGMPIPFHIVEVGQDQAIGFVQAELSSADGRISLAAACYLRCELGSGAVTSLGYRALGEPAAKGLFPLEEGMKRSCFVSLARDSLEDIDLNSPAPAGRYIELTDDAGWTYDGDYLTVAYTSMMSGEPMTMTGEREVIVRVTDAFRRTVETAPFAFDEQGGLTQGA